MKLQKADFNDRQEQLNIYLQKSIEELEAIQPKWAYGKDVDKILDYAQHPENKECSIFLVEPEELIMKAELFEINTEIIFTDEVVNDYRIASILHR